MSDQTNMLASRLGSMSPEQVESIYKQLLLSREVARGSSPELYNALQQKYDTMTDARSKNEEMVQEVERYAEEGKSDANWAAAFSPAKLVKGVSDSFMTIASKAAGPAGEALESAYSVTTGVIEVKQKIDEGKVGDAVGGTLSTAGTFGKAAEITTDNHEFKQLSILGSSIALSQAKDEKDYYNVSKEAVNMGGEVVGLASKEMGDKIGMVGSLLGSAKTMQEGVENIQEGMEFREEQHKSLDAQATAVKNQIDTANERLDEKRFEVFGLKERIAIGNDPATNDLIKEIEARNPHLLEKDYYTEARTESGSIREKVSDYAATSSYKMPAEQLESYKTDKQTETLEEQTPAEESDSMTLPPLSDTSDPSGSLAGPSENENATQSETDGNGIAIEAKAAIPADSQTEQLQVLADEIEEKIAEEETAAETSSELALEEIEDTEDDVDVEPDEPQVTDDNTSAEQQTAETQTPPSPDQEVMNEPIIDQVATNNEQADELEATQASTEEPLVSPLASNETPAIENVSQSEQTGSSQVIDQAATDNEQADELQTTQASTEELLVEPLASNATPAIENVSQSEQTGSSQESQTSGSSQQLASSEGEGEQVSTTEEDDEEAGSQSGSRQGSGSSPISREGSQVSLDVAATASAAATINTGLEADPMFNMAPVAEMQVSEPALTTSEFDASFENVVTDETSNQSLSETEIESDVTNPSTDIPGTGEMVTDSSGDVGDEEFTGTLDTVTDDLVDTSSESEEAGTDSDALSATDTESSSDTSDTEVEADDAVASATESSSDTDMEDGAIAEGTASEINDSTSDSADAASDMADTADSSSSESTSEYDGESYSDSSSSDYSDSSSDTAISSDAGGGGDVSSDYGGGDTSVDSGGDDSGGGDSGGGDSGGGDSGGGDSGGGDSGGGDSGGGDAGGGGEE